MIKNVLITLSLLCGATACGAGGSQQPKAMLEEDLKCPDNSISEIARWGGVGENGWSHSCKLRHGKYHVWKGDILAIEGQYVYGKKDGIWKFRDKQGRTTKKIQYTDGKEISVTDKVE